MASKVFSKKDHVMTSQIKYVQYPVNATWCKVNTRLNKVIPFFSEKVYAFTKQILHKEFSL